MLDDLTSLKDDMTAFIEGHGMRRFHGYVNDEVTSVMWDPHGNVDGWKDFVELAKASGAPFLTMNDVVLDREDVDFMVERLRNSNYTNEEDVDEARWLRTYIGNWIFSVGGNPAAARAREVSGSSVAAPGAPSWRLILRAPNSRGRWLSTVQESCRANPSWAAPDSCSTT